VTEPTPPAHPSFVLQVPDALEGGVYSNVVVVWHTPYEFTLDFAVMLLPQMVTPTEGGQPVRVTPARVVSRVKIPPSAVFELMRALSENEHLYEENIGPIPRPGRPDADPPLFPRALRPILAWDGPTTGEHRCQTR
jgi:hypothetical protein